MFVQKLLDLRSILSGSASIEPLLLSRDWMLIQDRIKEHPDFDRWFVEYPEDTTWMEANLFDGDASEHRSGKT